MHNGTGQMTGQVHGHVMMIGGGGRVDGQVAGMTIHPETGGHVVVRAGGHVTGKS